MSTNSSPNPRNLDEKKIREAILQVVGRGRTDYSTLTQEELGKVCKSLGFKLSPYLVVEAHLVSCGGFAT